MRSTPRNPSPDRIYFDLHRAKLTPKIAKKDLDVKEGLLKSMRIAQNKDGVVRLVLDVDGARDYSAYLLASPYRLVIEVHAKSVAGGSEAAVRRLLRKPQRRRTDSDSKSRRGSERGEFP